MISLLKDIRNCTVCLSELPFGTNPIIVAHQSAKIVIIGQAPGSKVHKSGIPWDDQSGIQLRKWMNIEEKDFYNERKMAIMPMGFCYPGKGKSGDLAPRKECAPLWHNLLFEKMDNVELSLLIGKYAQQYYLASSLKKNLTETVKNYNEYLPSIIPLPHPSPRNRIWLKKNPWFENEIVPVLQRRIKNILFEK